MHYPLILGSAIVVLSACSATDPSTDTLSGLSPETLVAIPEPIAPAYLAEYDSHSTQSKQARLLTPSAVPPPPSLVAIPPSLEHYDGVQSHSITRVSEQPVSTFSLDVDTGSYANVRRFLQQGQLPPAAAVRIEELVNYFDYDTPRGPSAQKPFALHTELSAAPWDERREILKIGLAAWQPTTLPAANLVFLIDVSGSMGQPNKLPLLKSALRLLTKQLRAQDRISIVTYTGRAGVALAPTPGDQQRTILDAIDGLGAGGSTNGEGGIRKAYQLASENAIDGGINRILLATDGDFNVGVSDQDSLIKLIEQQRESGIALSTLGFGQGNYNDALMEQLADHGNGNYAYIDTLSEAKKVLQSQMGATLLTVAKDAKIQVEFNPAVIAEYRLLGYENRQLREEDFRDDRVDAGDIGAGHTVVALYEVSRSATLPERRYADPTPTASTATERSDELAWVKLRYKPQGQENSLLMESIVGVAPQAASRDTRLATSVAAWGLWLRNEAPAQFDIDAITELAQSAIGTAQNDDPHGYRRELVKLMELSAGLR